MKHGNLMVYLFLCGIQRESPTLSNEIKKEKFARQAKLRMQEIHLFQCFLDTRLMICQPEEGKPQTLPKEMDPLHQLFTDNKITGLLSILTLILAVLLPRD